MQAVWFILGAAAGVVGASLVARWRFRRALARLRAAEQRARSAERLAELGAMTSGLAHEIKNPLSTIGLNAQLLGEGLEQLPTDQPASPEDRQRLARRLTSLRRETERLRGILSDFLTYAGELRLDPRPTDVNAVVDEIADFFEPQAVRQGVRLRTQLAPGVASAVVDSQALKQALLNLLLNAVQAMHAPQPGPKDLMLRTSVQAEADGQKMVVLEVIDTGPGMPAEVAGKVFTPYFTTKSGGSGLGLPTARRLVEAQHGRIDLHTEPGRGTSFRILFPEHDSDPDAGSQRMVERADPDGHPRPGQGAPV